MGNALIYSYLNRKEISRYMSMADFIISRPGYTTVMEMIEMGKRGIFIPTPGQLEQEYLSKHFMENKWCLSISQHQFNLLNSLQTAKSYEGFPKNFSRAKENLDKLFREVIDA